MEELRKCSGPLKSFLVRSEKSCKVSQVAVVLTDPRMKSSTPSLFNASNTTISTTCPARFSSSISLRAKLKNDIPASEVPEGDNTYDLVNERAYRTYKEHKEDKGVIPLEDELVQPCRDGKAEKAVADAAEVITEEARKKEEPRRKDRSRGRGGRDSGGAGLEDVDEVTVVVNEQRLDEMTSLPSGAEAICTAKGRKGWARRN